MCVDFKKSQGEDICYTWLFTAYPGVLCGAMTKAHDRTKVRMDGWIDCLRLICLIR